MENENLTEINSNEKEEKYLAKKKLTNKDLVKRLVFDATFAAITYVLYAFVKFPLPIFPSFLDINISMIPVIICAFMLGPWDASLIVIIRCLVKWIFPGTGTAFVGELADVLIGLSCVIPAGLIYHKSNFKHKTIWALLSVVIAWVLMGILSNIIINIPWYSHLYFKTDYYKDGVPNALVGMCNDAFKLISFGNITDVNQSNFMFYYIFFAVIPFNLLLSLIVIGVTALVHKRLKILYDMI